MALFCWCLRGEVRDGSGLKSDPEPGRDVQGLSDCGAIRPAFGLVVAAEAWTAVTVGRGNYFGAELYLNCVVHHF